jgi:hypothetical protein
MTQQESGTDVYASDESAVGIAIDRQSAWKQLWRKSQPTDPEGGE